MEDRPRDNAAGPRLRRARISADSRALLRSRPVQALLLSVTVISGVTSFRNDGGRAPVKQAAAPATQARPAPAPADLAALTLAGEYRARGYPVTDDLAREIASAATRYGIDVKTAFGLVATESEFKRTARSPVGAIGLAQVMPRTAALLEPGTTREDLKDPETNLRLGFRFLRDMIEHYDGDTATALTAYNRGPSVVDRILKKGGDPDNGYAKKVMSGGPRRGPNS